MTSHIGLRLSFVALLLCGSSPVRSQQRASSTADPSELDADAGAASRQMAMNQSVSTPDNDQSPSSSAPTSTPHDGWHIDVTPYIWFASVHGDSGLRGHQVGVHAGVGEVLSYLNIGLMGSAELRYHRVVVPLDFMWVKLSDDKALPFDQGATSAKAKFDQTVFTPGIGYRLVDKDGLTIDALSGIRYWHLGGSLSLQPSQAGLKVSSGADWVDGIGGGRIRASLTPNASLEVIGNAGGGAANLDYEVAGLIGMRVSKSWTVKAGYRYLSVNYRPQSTFVYDMVQSGIIFGASWNVR